MLLLLQPSLQKAPNVMPQYVGERSEEVMQVSREGGASSEIQSLASSEIASMGQGQVEGVRTQPGKGSDSGYCHILPCLRLTSVW